MNRRLVINVECADLVGTCDIRGMWLSRDRACGLLPYGWQLSREDMWGKQCVVIGRDARRALIVAKDLRGNISVMVVPAVALVDRRGELFFANLHDVLWSDAVLALETFALAKQARGRYAPPRPVVRVAAARAA